MTATPAPTPETLDGAAIWVYPQGTPLENMDQETLERLRTAAEARRTQADADRIRFELDVAQKHVAYELARADHHHVYSFDHTVDGRTVAQAIEVLGRWSRRDPGCDITIIFNSPGGSVFHGLALYDFIIELRKTGHHRITTLALGMAASMGGILLQAGDTRIIGRNAWVLIHEVQSIGMGKTSELEDEVALIQRLQRQLVAILAERSTMTSTQILRRWKRRDWWLDADECLKLGFVDEVQ